MMSPLIYLFTATLIVGIESVALPQVEEFNRKLADAVNQFNYEDFETIEMLRSIVADKDAWKDLKGTEHLQAKNLYLVRGLANYMGQIMKAQYEAIYGTQKRPMQSYQDASLHRELVSSDYRFAFNDKFVDTCNQVKSLLAEPMELYNKLRSEESFNLSQLDDLAKKWIVNNQLCAELLADSDYYLTKSYSLVSLNNIV